MKEKVVSIIFLFIAQVSTQGCSFPGGSNILISNLAPKYIGEIFNETVDGAIKAYIDGSNEVVFSRYFYAELNEERTRYFLYTTQEFENFEKHQNDRTFRFAISFECESFLTASKSIFINLAEINNYAPEFSNSNYEIEILTPLPTGFQVSFFSNEEITAIDYDLSGNALEFSLSGSDLFEIEVTEMTNENRKLYYVIKMFTTQRIYFLENGEIELTLTATDTFSEGPKSTSVPIKISIDQENAYVPPPAFVKPLYKGLLFTNGTLWIDEIRLNENTYDESVTFDVLDNFYGLIVLSNDGPQITIETNQTNLNEEIFKQKFLSFVIEAKRTNESGYASVIIDVSSSTEMSKFSFSKFLYEGEFQEKSKSLSIENIIVQEYNDEISFTYARPDAEFFNFNETTSEILITLKEDVSIELMMAKTSLIFTIDAYQNDFKIASTTIVINNIAAIVPQFDKKFYIGSVVNGSLKPLTIMITEETYNDPVVVYGENEYFEVKNNEREVLLSLKNETTIPSDIKLVTFVIEVKEEERKSEALVIIEIENEENLIESLQFESILYQGILFRNSSITHTEVKLNFQENVTFELTGIHGSYFNFDKNELKIVLKDQYKVEQFVDEDYLQITINAVHENMKSTTTNIILSIEKDIDSLFFNSAFYEGSFSSNLSLILPKITLNQNEGVSITFDGRHGNYFDYKFTENNLEIYMKDEYTFEQIASETYLQITINAAHENMTRSLVFNSALYEGSFSSNLSLILPTITLNQNGGVSITFDGRHGNYFDYKFTENNLEIYMKDEYTFEQIASETYLQITINAAHENMTSTSANVILKILKEDVNYQGSLVFNSALYEGSFSSNLSLILPTITLNQNEGVSITFDGRHGNYFDYKFTENNLEIYMKDEYTFEQIASETYLQITINAAHENMTSTSANVILKILKEDINYQGSLVFNSALYEGSFSSNLSLILPKITITLNQNEGVSITFDGTHGNFFTWSFSEKQLILQLKDDINFAHFINDVYLQIEITATHETLKSATVYAIIKIIKKEESEETLNFSLNLFEGKLSTNGMLSFDSNISIIPYEGVNLALLGKHKDFFTFMNNQGQLSIVPKSDINLEQFKNDLYLHLILAATHESLLPTSANVIIGIERNIEISNQVLEFNSELYEGTITQDLILDISTFTLNYYGEVNINLSGTHGNLFTFTKIQNEVKIEIKYDVTFEQFSDNFYLHVLIEASRENYKSARTNVIISIKRNDEVQDNSKFEKSLYIGSINNQKLLNIESIFIQSENFYTSVNITGLDSEYFTAILNQNFVSLILAKEITQDLIFQKTILTAQIIAQHENSLLYTNLIITMPRITEDKILRFENSYYIGSLDNELKLSIEDIVLELDNYNDSVNFSWNGNDMKYFDYDRNENVIKLKLLDNINEEEIKEKVFLSIKLRAERNEFVSAETVIFIHLNVIVSNISPIQFESPIYIGNLTHDQILKVETPKLLTDDNLMIDILHNGEHKDKFIIKKSPELEGNSIEIEISFISQPIDVRKKFYYFYIEAAKIGTPKTYATIVIEIIDKIQYEFKDMKYFGRLDGYQALIMNPIQIDSQFMEGPSFSIHDGQHQFFRVMQASNSLQIMKISQIPNEILQNFRYLWFYLEASGSSFYPAKTLVIIETTQSLPDIPIEECYDTLDQTQPFFVTSSYFFTITNDFIGFIASVKAMTIDKSVNLAYTLTMENSFLYEKLVIIDGNLILQETIPTGIYKVIVTAKNHAHNKEASASVVLKVTEASLCENGEIVTTVNKALAIVEMEENTINNQIMYSKIGNCDYEILQINPSALRDHITIDTSTNFIKNIKEFDRESEIFKNYLVPQVHITLRLYCGSSIQNTTSLLSITPYTANAYTDEILFSTSITYLNLIILDQNDNPPIFINPTQTNFNIGFPDEKLIEITMPKYLFKAEAYDLDEGINAVIKYSTNMPSIFYIDSVTGEIHSMREMSNETFTLILSAIDRNGEGLKTSISLNVVKLTTDKVLEIVVETTNDLTQFINELSSQTGLDLRILSSTQIPFALQNEIFWLNIIPSSYEAKNKIFVYAFEQSSLLMADELLERLSIVQLNVPIKYGFINICIEDIDAAESCDLKGWIFAVSFMGTILFLIIIAIPLIYIFWLRPKLTNDLKSTSSKEEFGENFYSEPGTSTPVVNEINENSERQTDAEVLGIELEGVTEDSSTSDAEKLSNKLLSYLEDDDTPTNEKKNVSFKEIVERIEVFEDREDKT
ncbi:hypothetical protein PVAND_010487 [Polypedilum vanderplanki]|uniref:Cadherin domain-containing protein n=1 Tax=Polypedilum vanderplanki TaxID=319348 RepID=A0A9J6CGE0_POLVA|nr:hypothetical protein PVAND_010487 [Polypedilum vanderplanki]